MNKFQLSILLDETISFPEVLLKARETEEIAEIVTLLEEYDKGKTTKLLIKTADGVEVIEKSVIQIIESFGKKVEITTEEEVYQTNGPLYQVIERINDVTFIQISKSVYVQMKNIRRLELSFSGNYLVEVGKRKLSVSRRFVKELLRRLEKL
ncbi:LytTr DNA-binding domain-containing protein [Pilibacter termitis]|uniref:LytTr DNA-binding domain-containing protein n=1 Tax=Pilibacter termitis TaxID=263852 RepID=A0A1T4NVH4_9ENTE|nr:LytTR family DNA-binding domain-containing protein [Pilibacter termitis]SJZ83223.1 LytTr DNA-binding domain-containing protein [Pilibacter termitis]